MKLYGFLMSAVLMLLVQPSIAANESDQTIYQPNQTSAALLVSYAERKLKSTGVENQTAEEKRFLLLYDLYIKARSYSLLNKVFFWLSIISAIAVLLWPSLGVVLQGKLNNMEWFKSAVVQTTVTGIAALTFAFYSQYKDKQTYTENLMRYVVFSHESVDDLSKRVAEEIVKIDRGFSFSGLINKED